MRKWTDSSYNGSVSSGWEGPIQVGICNLSREDLSMNRFHCLCLVVFLSVAAAFGWIFASGSQSTAADGGNWADAPANLTIEEYLRMIFKLEMNRPETKQMLNSFALANFYPSSTPEKSIVLVLQAWNDNSLQPQDMRREIRKVSEAEIELFSALANLTFVSKRWKIDNPKSNIVMRHVRYSDSEETLAVTINGETHFDEKEISKAKAEVIERGAIWNW